MRLWATLAALLVALAVSLALAASALADVPAQAEAECLNNGGGCRIVDVGGGCHVYRQFIGGKGGEIFAHNKACGYGTVKSGSYTDYLGDF